MRSPLTLVVMAVLTGCDPPPTELGTGMPQPILIPGEGISCVDESAMARRIAELEHRNLRLEKLVDALRAR